MPRVQGVAATDQPACSEAAKEGGFLGIGGVRVSEAEKATLTEIASALEV
jgi:hypothetical protein